jgi:hypothetical protein
VSRRFLIFLIAATVYIPIMLFFDAPGAARQVSLGIVTALFLALFGRDRKQIIVAIIIATTGEIVLSLGWGLYTYKNALIPLYVPVGHGVFYALAAETAKQQIFRKHATAIAKSVIVAGSAIALFGLVVFRDQWGMLWWIGAALMLARSRNQLLLSACFTYTIFLEWLGTWIGNWQWAATVPFVGLHSANPPSGVGILYILLDLMTVGACALILPVREAIHHVGEGSPGDALPGVALAAVPEQ